MEFRNPAAIANRLGERVLAALLKCFVGVDRIMTLERLMLLVQTAQQELPNSHKAAVDGAAHTRDVVYLGFQLGSTLHEMGEALQELCNVIGPQEDLRKLESWGPLNDVRAQWYTQPFSSKVRNQLGAHLGEQDSYLSGVRRLTGDTMTFHESAGSLRLFGRYSGPWEVLATGLGIYDDALVAFKAFVDRQFETHTKLPDLLYAFLGDVLSARHIPVIDERAP